MSKQIIVADKASRDASEAWNYLADTCGNVQAAHRLLADLEQSFRELAALPSLGHRRPDLTPRPAIRFYLVRGTYLVAYAVSEGTIQILRIFHGARDIRKELED